MKTREQKRTEAERRQEQYNRLSADQKLARALKGGHVGTREVNRLKELAKQEQEAQRASEESTGGNEEKEKVGASEE